MRAFAVRTTVVPASLVTEKLGEEIQRRTFMHRIAMKRYRNPLHVRVCRLACTSVWVPQQQLLACTELHGVAGLTVSQQLRQKEELNAF